MLKKNFTIASEQAKMFHLVFLFWIWKAKYLCHKDNPLVTKEDIT